MPMVSYYLYYDYAVILIKLFVQLHVYATLQRETNCIAKCVHPYTVVKIKNTNFSVLAWHGLYQYDVGALQYPRFLQCTINKAHK